MFSLILCSGNVFRSVSSSFFLFALLSVFSCTITVFRFVWSLSVELMFSDVESWSLSLELMFSDVESWSLSVELMLSDVESWSLSVELMFSDVKSWSLSVDLCSQM